MVSATEPLGSSSMDSHDLWIIRFSYSFDEVRGSPKAFRKAHLHKSRQVKFTALLLMAMSLKLKVSVCVHMFRKKAAHQLMIVYGKRLEPEN